MWVRANLLGTVCGLERTFVGIAWKLERTFVGFVCGLESTFRDTVNILHRLFRSSTDIIMYFLLYHNGFLGSFQTLKKKRGGYGY
jgi:hypothetical protein